VQNRAIHNMTIGIRDTYTSTFWLAPPLSFSWISVHPTNPQIAYLGTANGFLYRTQNGGKYWKETRLIVNQPKFFGAIRKSGAKLGVGIKGSAKRLQAQIRAYWGRKSKAWLDYPYSYPYAMRRTSIKVVKSPLNITPGSINLKQYLVMRSGAMSRIPMRINHIGFDPANKNVAFVATAYGVFKTTDNGMSWQSVFFGGTRAERNTIWVVVHPKNSNRVFLGTMGGLFISEDGGLSWNKDFRTPLGSSKVLKISFFAQNPDIIYAGTAKGLWKSTDGGKNWSWVYGLKESGMREAFVIERIAVSNKDPDLVYIGTQDGVFKTTNGGDSWHKIHEGLLSRRYIRGLRISPKNDQHIYMAVEHDLYESWDGGKTWEAIYVPVGQWWINEITFNKNNPNTLWVLTDRMILRLQPASKGADSQRSQQNRAALEKKFPPLPSMSSLLNRAFRHAHVHQAQLRKKRERAFVNHLLPKIDVGYTYHSKDYAGNFRLAKWRFSPLDPWLYENYFTQRHIFVAMLTWDLSKLFYDAEVLQFGRIAVQARWVRRNIRDKVMWLFDEASRLRALLLNHPPSDPLLRITYTNRLEEIYSLLNIQTGNYLSGPRDD
jgi:photosystem II stability/assembly factor-like uncharacterized protein